MGLAVPLGPRRLWAACAASSSSTVGGSPPPAGTGASRCGATLRPAADVLPTLDETPHLVALGMLLAGAPGREGH